MTGRWNGRVRPCGVDGIERGGLQPAAPQKSFWDSLLAAPDLDSKAA